MNKLTLITLVMLLAAELAAQSASQPPSMSPNERWVFGGNVALGFGNTFTVIGASPTIGYRFTERFTAGGGAIYFYQRWSTAFGGSRSTSIYGPQAFARFQIAQDIVREGDRLFAQTDYYLVNTETYNVFNERFERLWVQQWFVGGGYYMQVGRRMFAGVMVMWDVVADRRAPFPNPMIRGGVSFGL